MTEVRHTGPWTIPGQASRSFAGETGEVFRRLMLTLAATLQRRSVPPGRGCWFTSMDSEVAIKEAFLLDRADPMLVWMPQDKVRGHDLADATRVVATYDTQKEFVLWAQTPERGFMAKVPLHSTIYDGIGGIGSPVDPVRTTCGIDSASLISNALRACATCRKKPVKKSDLSRCTGCKCVYYCSKDCQRAHWPEHKKTCNPNVARS